MGEGCGKQEVKKFFLEKNHAGVNKHLYMSFTFSCFDMLMYTLQVCTTHICKVVLFDLLNIKLE